MQKKAIPSSVGQQKKLVGHCGEDQSNNCQRSGLGFHQPYGRHWLYPALLAGSRNNKAMIKV
jgi:hypothetical protein